MTHKTKTIAITGGNSGIGLMTVKTYLAQGERVAAFSRTIDHLQVLQKEYPEQLIAYQGNVENINQLECFYQHLDTQWGNIDIVIANAGIAPAEPMTEVSEQSFDNTFAINVKGVFFTLQKSVPYLKKGASITLISSIQAYRGAGIWAAYGASKAAVRSLARSFAAELSSQSIRVNCLSPGVTATPILNKFGLEDSIVTGMLEQATQNTPLQRIGSAKDIANAIVFINSEQASFITGIDLHVDGGLIQV